MRMVIGRNLTAGLVGTIAGLVGAFWVSRFLGRFLFGIEALDPLTYAVVCALGLTVCAVASYLPARRGTRVDLVEELRTE